MSWSWNQIVADEVLRLVNDRRAPDFSLDDLYQRQAVFEARFPNNGHVREKVRQTLQRLRDEGFITFQGNGEYRLNLAFDDLDIVPASNDEAGLAVPKRRVVARSLILRDTLLATNVKRRYEFICQVCHTALEMTVGRYAEGHHLKPLGAPHNGPDVGEQPPRPLPQPSCYVRSWCAVY